MSTVYGLLFTVPVEFQDDGPVHDGKAQQANPPQEDTSKHTGIEVQDHHLQKCRAELTFTHLRTLIVFGIYRKEVRDTNVVSTREAELEVDLTSRISNASTVPSSVSFMRLICQLPEHV